METKGPLIGPSVIDVLSAPGAIGAGEIGSQQERKPGSHARKDRKRVHVTRHGALSRYPLEALVRLGENTRQLKRIERLFRAELRPIGIVAEVEFDNLWSSYLRRLLIARVEMHALAPGDSRADGATSVPDLREAEWPTLVWPEQRTTMDDVSVDLIKHLSIFQRYDSHYSREFHRALGTLLALRTGGESALTRYLAKTLERDNERED